jgi:RNA polymerase sigma-70 factor, ECF subfamily
MQDVQLIRDFRNGDSIAFNKLVSRWQNKIHRFVYRYFADSDEAREITQKTFIKVYHRIDTLDDESKFSSWIYRIATNLCLDEMKRAGRRRSARLDDWIDTTEYIDINTPHSKLERKEMQQLLQKALQAIPKEQRAVIILKEFEKLTFREIAEILEEPENTVKSRMYYGLKALRKIFHKWNINSEIMNYE